MQPSTTIDVKKTLDDLAESSFPFQRRQAALSLGQVSATSEEILRALIAAETLDDHAGVRTAASQALQAPVHRAYLEAHPDFQSQAAKQAERAQAEKKIADEERVIAEFIDLRTRMRRRLLVIPLAVFLPMTALLLPEEWWLSGYWIDSILVVLYLGYVFWWSWKHYRCPACDSWLGAMKAQVNPWFSSPPLRCPNCGAKLLM